LSLFIQIDGCFYIKVKVHLNEMADKRRLDDSSLNDEGAIVEVKKQRLDNAAAVPNGKPKILQVFFIFLVPY